MMTQIQAPTTWQGRAASDHKPKSDTMNAKAARERCVSDVATGHIVAASIASIGLALLSATASADFAYQWDDGVANTAGGFSGYTADAAWMNVFAVNLSGSLITSIQVTFGLAGSTSSAGVSAGAPFNVHLWGDNDGDPANGMTHLGSWSALIDPGAIKSNVFQSVTVAPTDVSAFANIVVGVSVTVSNGFAAPIDTSVPTLDRSWFSTAPSGTWNAQFPGVIQSLNSFPALGGNGVFLLRAQAVPAPSAALLLALVALRTRGRRRG
ncbi:MAG: hypothetical protein KF724_08285 [Phycisphaeraceae bacterium]|nr:hypothetical protein [Phycisphaeraceae bacterium]